MGRGPAPRVRKACQAPPEQGIDFGRFGWLWWSGKSYKQVSPLPPSSAEIELVLIRHGQTTWNLAGRVQGHNDESRLTPEGLAQAAWLAERLAGERVAALWTSDLQRARQTAEALADGLGLGVRVHPGLRERNFGSYEGCPVSSLTAEVTGLAGHVVVDPDVAPPGGESIRQFSERVERALLEVTGELGSAPPGQRLALVVHGGTIRVAEAILAGLPVDRIDWGPVENAAVLRRGFARRLVEEGR